MTISVKTRKMLWGRSANRCAVCKLELVVDASETDDPSVVGEECHIVAQSTDGPRGNSDLPAEQRDGYGNLILMCNVHHKVIDDQPNAYTVGVLKDLKTKHEEWVRSNLAYDSAMQADDEMYAGYVAEWATRMHIDEWRNWASSLTYHGQPSLSSAMKSALEQIGAWILGRVWPHRYPQLEAALTNFRLIAQDLRSVFDEHAIRQGDDEWYTEKFYKIEDWDEVRYKQLAEQFHQHVALVQDLALELTRGANYVCDKVRDHVLRSYRIREGVLLIDSGPYMDMTVCTHRVEYRGTERIDQPYRGLAAFRQDRFGRDYCFGEPPAH